MQDKNATQGMNVFQPPQQTKKRGSNMLIVGITIVAAVVIIAILGFTVFADTLFPTQQTAGSVSSTLTGAAEQQQVSSSNAKLVCSVGLDVSSPSPLGVNVYWSAQGKIAASSANNLMSFTAKDCGAKTVTPTTSQGENWSPDGQKLLLLSESDKALQVLDKDGKAIATIPFTKLGAMFVGSLAWSPDGTKFLFVSRDSDQKESVKIADAADGGNVKTLITIDGDGGATGFGTISPDGKYVSAVDPKGDSIWDVNAGKKLSDLPADTTKGYSTEAFSPDGSLFARGRSGKIEIYSSADGKLQSTFNAEDNTGGLAWSHDSKYLAVSWKSISIYDVSAKKVVSTFGRVDEQHRISSIAWAPDGSGLVSATTEKNSGGHAPTPVNVWALN